MSMIIKHIQYALSIVLKILGAIDLCYIVLAYAYYVYRKKKDREEE